MAALSRCWMEELVAVVVARGCQLRRLVLVSRRRVVPGEEGREMSMSPSDWREMEGWGDESSAASHDQPRRAAGRAAQTERRGSM
jgi:hypothetical protein